MSKDTGGAAFLIAYPVAMIFVCLFAAYEALMMYSRRADGFWLVIGIGFLFVTFLWISSFVEAILAARSK